jgi:hypothetical protein
MLVFECHNNFGAILTREDQIKALDREQKNAAKFANHANDSFWETLARICIPFIAYTGEPGRKSIGDRSQGPCYLRRNAHDRKSMARK